MYVLFVHSFSYLPKSAFKDATSKPCGMGTAQYRKGERGVGKNGGKTLCVLNLILKKILSDFCCVCVCLVASSDLAPQELLHLLDPKR